MMAHGKTEEQTGRRKPKENFLPFLLTLTHEHTHKQKRNITISISSLKCIPGHLHEPGPISTSFLRVFLSPASIEISLSLYIYIYSSLALVPRVANRDICRAMESWKDCVLGARWLSEALTRTLHYASPLPVQQAVVPTIAKALLSDVPMDVSLTAPTGSGKTLCYLLPMLRFIAEEKKGIDSTRLRCLVLVPTKVLGQQVYREVQQLIRGTTMAATHWCGSDAKRDELRQLLRRVRCPGGSAAFSGCSSKIYSGAASLSTGEESSEDETDHDDGASEAEEDLDDAHAVGTDRLVRGSGRYTAVFFKADILISTPQRLLQHLDRVDQRLHLLSSLRLLVMDEADQVLGGHFANAVTKVVERFESETWQEQQAEEASARALAMRTPRWTERRPSGAVLHKMLCSASLSSRIARISEVRLRNCVFFALDSTGKPVDDPAAPQRTIAGVKHNAFSLPPQLQEHIIFVEEHYRHAVLLKLIRTLTEKLQMLRQFQRCEMEAAQKAEEEANDAQLDDENENEDSAVSEALALKKEAQDAQRELAEWYPNVEAGTGDRILVFCSSADEARVVAHFLHAGGIPGVLEFTTAATEAERRRVLLMRSGTASAGTAEDADGAAPSASSCIVASDALMRGVDIPGVAHVVMYHPPETLAQLIHRAGRTARAMRGGHLHLLLTKTGESSSEAGEGREADGQVAQYYQLCANVARTLPLRFERGFFKFRHAPGSRAKAAVAAPGKTPATDAPAESPPEPEPEAFTEEEGEWWVAEANRCLERSQHQLQRTWGSVMEMAKLKREQRKEAASSSSRAAAAATSIPSADRETQSNSNGGRTPPAARRDMADTTRMDSRCGPSRGATAAGAAWIVASGAAAKHPTAVVRSSRLLVISRRRESSLDGKQLGSIWVMADAAGRYWDGLKWLKPLPEEDFYFCHTIIAWSTIPAPHSNLEEFRSMSQPAPKKPQLSKHRTSFTRAKAKKDGAKGSKEHGYDARNFHQNANRREIRSLVKFNCPVCQCKNTAVVHMESRKMLATVRCGVCMMLQPPPDDLPYPYQTSYVPSLENKADIFFRFLDAYERIAKQDSGSTGSLRAAGVACSVAEDEDDGLDTSEGSHLLDFSALAAQHARDPPQQDENEPSRSLITKRTEPLRRKRKKSHLNLHLNAALQFSFLSCLLCFTGFLIMLPKAYRLNRSSTHYIKEQNKKKQKEKQKKKYIESTAQTIYTCLPRNLILSLPTEMLHASYPLLLLGSATPRCLALEAVKIANRSTKLPVNLLTMKSHSGGGGTSSSAGGGSSSSAGLGGAGASAYSFSASDAASLLPPNTKASYAMEMRTITFTPSIPSSEFFFFGPKETSTFCVLCHEDIEPPFTQRMHVAASSRASHTNHSCREVALDHMALLAIRGYPLESMYMVWADVLHCHPNFPRIHAFTSPKWSWEERAEALLPHLKFLREAKVLDLCLAGVVPQTDTVDSYQARRRVAFERVEYIGDCAWGPHIANRLMLLYPNEQWVYSDRVYAFNCTRDAVEMNITLELLFDSLHLTDLLPIRCADNVGSGKIKADVVEAVLGELHCVVWGLEPQMEDDAPFVEINGEEEGSLLMLAQHCLTEMYDLLVLGYARELSWNAMPLAKYLAAKNLWMETLPAMRLHKSGRRHWNRRSSVSTSMGLGGSSVGSGVSPAVLQSFAFHQPPPATAPGGAGLFSSPTSVVSAFLSTAAPAPATTGAAVTASERDGREDSPTGEGEVEGERTSAATPSETDAAGDGPSSAPGSPSTTNAALPRGFHRHTAGGGPRFMLPGLPRLHPNATPYPSRIPHPLLQKENQPPHSASVPSPSSFQARQRLTTFEYTGGDVFAAFHKSFERLGLLHDDTRRLRHIVLPAVLSAAAQQLVESLAPSAAAEAGSATYLKLLMSAAGQDVEGGSVFFRDPYYALTNTPEKPQAITLPQVPSLLGTPAAEEKKDGGEPSGAQEDLPFTPSAAQESVVWLGGRRGSAISTPARPVTLQADVTASVALATAHAFPRLQSDSDAVEGDGEGSDSEDGDGDLVAGVWRRSKWVPADAKPPKSAVVTDQHPTHPGAFAYLAVGIPKPIETAQKRLAGLERLSAAEPAAEAQSAGEASKEGDTPTVVESGSSSSSEGAAQDADGKMNAEVKQNGSNDGTDARHNSAADGASAEEISKAARRVAWEFWVKQCVDKWQHENPYFAQRTTAGNLGRLSPATTRGKSRFTPVGPAASATPVFSPLTAAKENSYFPPLLVCWFVFYMCLSDLVRGYASEKGAAHMLCDTCQVVNVSMHRRRTLRASRKLCRFCFEERHVTTTTKEKGKKNKQQGATSAQYTPSLFRLFRRRS
eukprot:gene5726-4087_t